MEPVMAKMNRKIFGFINRLDPQAEKDRPVTFWFYSESEENIYHLAEHFRNNGYHIEYCDRFIKEDYLCIAERVIVPDNRLLDKLCIDMQLLAEKFEVTFDGWETMIDLDENEENSG